MNDDPESKFPKCETIKQAYVSGCVAELFWLETEANQRSLPPPRTDEQCVAVGPAA